MTKQLQIVLCVMLSLSLPLACCITESAHRDRYDVAYDFKDRKLSSNWEKKGNFRFF